MKYQNKKTNDLNKAKKFRDMAIKYEALRRIMPFQLKTCLEIEN